MRIRKRESRIIGHIIENARLDKGLSLRAFANQIGISEQVLSRIEDRSKIPSVEELSKIAKDLNLEFVPCTFCSRIANDEGVGTIVYTDLAICYDCHVVGIIVQATAQANTDAAVFGYAGFDFNSEYPNSSHTYPLLNDNWILTTKLRRMEGILPSDPKKFDNNPYDPYEIEGLRSHLISNAIRTLNSFILPNDFVYKEIASADTPAESLWLLLLASEAFSGILPHVIYPTEQGQKKYRAEIDARRWRAQDLVRSRIYEYKASFISKEDTT